MSLYKMGIAISMMFAATSLVAPEPQAKITAVVLALIWLVYAGIVGRERRG